MSQIAINLKSNQLLRLKIFFFFFDLFCVLCNGFFASLSLYFCINGITIIQKLMLVNLNKLLTNRQIDSCKRKILKWPYHACSIVDCNWTAIEGIWECRNHSSCKIAKTLNVTENTQKFTIPNLHFNQTKFIFSCNRSEMFWGWQETAAKKLGELSL